MTENPLWVSSCPRGGRNHRTSVQSGFFCPSIGSVQRHIPYDTAYRLVGCIGAAQGIFLADLPLMGLERGSLASDGVAAICQTATKSRGPCSLQPFRRRHLGNARDKDPTTRSIAGSSASSSLRRIVAPMTGIRQRRTNRRGCSRRPSSWTMDSFECLLLGAEVDIAQLAVRPMSQTAHDRVVSTP